jgi:hypothetical protein
VVARFFEKQISRGKIMQSYSSSRRTQMCALAALLIMQLGVAHAGQAVFWGTGGDSGSGNLWVTDGTPVGTKELTVQNADPDGFLRPLGLGPNFTLFKGKAMFAGVDSLNHQNLWVTDGTSSKTKELKVAGADANGLLTFGFSGYPDFTVLGTKVLFEGFDASTNHVNLWVSNGTASGTKELKLKNVSSSGLFNLGFPAQLTVLGQKALFIGQGSTGGVGLWITDGTASGTSEVGVNGAYSGGLFQEETLQHPDFTVLGKKVLFEGLDTSGSPGLWITDGTSANTREIKLKNTLNSGPFGGGAPEFTSLGKTAVFYAVDANQRWNLWVTDGTGAGTKELKVKNAYSGGLFGNFLSVDSVNVVPQFIAFKGKALFVGIDGFGTIGLWITDGTASGTKELKAKGAYTGGLFFNKNYFGPDFTAFGNAVLFLGMDAKGNHKLWTTDGTSAGTKEIKVKGAFSAGLLNFSPSSWGPIFTVLAPNAMLFDGFDANNRLGLWITDGTAAQTKELTTTTVPYDITVLP